jgi:2-oxoglutarate ferredoxin oxidoreductase subunit delta
MVRRPIRVREAKMVEATTETKPPNIDIYRAWCKSCGICVAFCPTGTLARDETGSPYVKHPDKCIKCGLCELRCPDFAITVHEKKERQARGGQ